MYTIINDEKKVNFEKEYQIPYGYACAHIHATLEKAFGYLLDAKECGFDVSNHIVEYHDAGESDIVYRGSFLYQ